MQEDGLPLVLYVEDYIRNWHFLCQPKYIDTFSTNLKFLIS